MSTSTAVEAQAVGGGEDFAELEQDRKLFEFKAPADGLFYHGSIENGTWSTGDLIKTLVQ